jgi:transposase InsO family protein
VTDSNHQLTHRIQGTPLSGQPGHRRRRHDDKTKARYPQTNGICECFHKTVLQEFYQVTFRKKLHELIEKLQLDLDTWLAHDNNERTHQGKMCCGRTPLDALIDGKPLWEEKLIA